MAALEREEMKAYIKDRKAEFLSRYGAILSDQRLDLVVEKVITEELDVNSAFEELIATYYQIRGFEKSFMERHGIEITLDEEAMDLLLTWVVKEDKDITETLSTLDSLFEPALQLIRDKTGVSNFSISKEGVDNPEDYFNKLVTEVYA